LRVRQKNPYLHLDTHLDIGASKYVLSLALITLQPSTLFAQKPRIAILILSSKLCSISVQEYSILTAFWLYLLATWPFHVSPTASSDGDTRNRCCFAVHILPLLLELNHIAKNDPWHAGRCKFHSCATHLTLIFTLYIDIFSFIRADCTNATINNRVASSCFC
jgi:hypothetical protein